MTQLDLHPPEVSISPASQPDLQTARRLIVLVPEIEADPVLIARKVRELAFHFESRVQLLGLSPDELHEPGLRRRLITLAAYIEDARIPVETGVEVGRNWLKAVQPHWRAGDMIVYFAEMGMGLKNQTLRPLLGSKIGASIYVVSDFLPKAKPAIVPLYSSILAWTGSLALIAGFFWLQVKLLQFAQSGNQSPLLYGSLVVEAGSIWLWNIFFS